jgi:hypothetical protein
MARTRPALRHRRRAPATSLPPASEGLTALDVDRAQSLADEGGSSAAAVESQDGPPSLALDEREERTRETNRRRP